MGILKSFKNGMRAGAWIVGYTVVVSSSLTLASAVYHAVKGSDLSEEEQIKQQLKELKQKVEGLYEKKEEKSDCNFDSIDR